MRDNPSTGGRDAVWHVMTGYARRIGSGAGFYGGLESNPYDVDRSYIAHPYNSTFVAEALPGSIGRPGTVAYGGPVSCTITVPKEGLYHSGEASEVHLNVGYGETTIKPSDILGYGMAVRIPFASAVPSGDEYALDYVGSVRMYSACSTFDRLFLSLVTRDSA